MKISVDHVTNSSSESFGTVIIDTAVAIGLSMPFIAVTLGVDGASAEGEMEIPEDDWGYQPHESTDPNDPPGTIIQNNPDGSITKTLPDGTVGTKMPDGTIHGTTPSGLTVVVEPDGHQIITEPNGTKVEIYTDGTEYILRPDGRTKTTYEDGTIVETTPDGDSYRYTSDDEVLLEPTYTYDEKGKITSVADSKGNVIHADENGQFSGTLTNDQGKPVNISGDCENGVLTDYGNGNYVEWDNQGGIKKLEFKNENGSVIMREDNSVDFEMKDLYTNSHIKASGDGQGQWEFDGEGTDPETGVHSKYKMDNNGNLDYSNSQGDSIQVEVDQEGNVSGKISTADGHMDMRENADGSGYIRGEADGAKIDYTTDSKGNSHLKIESDDGNLEMKQNADGSGYIKGEVDGDSMEATMNADGSGQFEAEVDGKEIKVTKSSDGGYEASDGEGNYEKLTVNEDGSTDYESSNNGVDFKGQIDEKGNFNCDGSDGSKLIINQDEGEVVITDPDGTTTTYTQEDIHRMQATQKGVEVQ